MNVRRGRPRREDSRATPSSRLTHSCSAVEIVSKTSRQVACTNLPKLSSRVPVPGCRLRTIPVGSDDGGAVGASGVAVSVAAGAVGVGDGVAAGVAGAGEGSGVGVEGIAAGVAVGVTGTGDGVAVCVGWGVGVGDGAGVGAGIGVGDGASAARVAVGAACGVAPPVASGTATGGGLCSAMARAVGGGTAEGSDSMGPHVAPTATSIRHASAARRHHARICSRPPGPAPGRPRILVERAPAMAEPRAGSTLAGDAFP